MRAYLDLLQKILDQGTETPDRTGVGTRYIFGDTYFRHDLSQGFPAITTKKLAFKIMLRELLWFIKGSSDVSELQAQNVHIWDGDVSSPVWAPKAKFPGDGGRIYGVQWRDWRSAFRDEPIDQLANAIELIKKVKTEKNSSAGRRIIVTAWNPGELDMMCLPPCHILFQFDVSPDDRLSTIMYQRSADMFLGVPFNIASYALLTHMVAQVAGLKPGYLTIYFGNAHIYLNHLDAVKEQLARAPLPLPELKLNPEIKNINDFKEEDIELINYQHHDLIKAPLNTQTVNPITPTEPAV